MSVGRKDYEERKDHKIEAYGDRAEKANAQSIQLSNRANEMGAAIPFGQPILIGHHSEKRHRALLKRIKATTKKSIEEADKAAYYQDRAETTVNNTSISGDDPEAIKKYQDKLSKLEALQELMKAANAHWRKYKTMKGYQGIPDEEAEQIDEKMKTAYSWVQKSGPYEAWRLSNNNAEIHRIKEKIDSLKKLDCMETETITFPGGELRMNIEINRVQFIFDDKPSEEVRSILKHNGFRWAPSEGAWQRQRTANAIRDAKWLIKDIEKIIMTSN